MHMTLQVIYATIKKKGGLMENNLQVMEMPTMIASLNLRGFDMSNVMQYMEAQNVVSWNDGIAVRYGINNIQGQNTNEMFPFIGKGVLETTNIFGIKGTAGGVSVPTGFTGFTGIKSSVGLVSASEDNEKKLYFMFIDWANRFFIQPFFEYDSSNVQGFVTISNINKPLLPLADVTEPVLFSTMSKMFVPDTEALRTVAYTPFEPGVYHNKFIDYTTIKMSISDADEAFLMQGENIPDTTPPKLYFSSYGEPYEIPDRSSVVIFQTGSSGLLFWKTNIDVKSIHKRHTVMHESFDIRNTGSLDFTAITGWTKMGTSNGNARWVVAIKYQGIASLTILGIATGKKAIVGLFNSKMKEELRTVDYEFGRRTSPFPLIWYDPTEDFIKPWEGGKQVQRWNGVDTTVKTCWRTHENAFVFSSSTSSDNVYAEGILEAKKVYEYTYSIFNALNGRESNVGSPALIRSTSTTGWSILYKPSGKEHGHGQETLNILPTLTDLFGSASQYDAPINYLYFCFYYRELGSFEWLPAGEESFVYAYFRRFGETGIIGSGQQTGTLGGQPGGFNDYSLLPKNDWFQVTTFDERLFWVSKEEIRFSGDHPLDYPVRHFVTIPSGEIRGVISQFFPGTAYAGGRLVIFGSEGVFDMRRSGELLTQMIRISADLQPQPVPLEGSDFVVSFRSKETAFSFRSAVVAEGILYFWGPLGIYRDDSVSFPQKISMPLEREIFECYDGGKTEDIFAFYDSHTQNIFFFYQAPNESFSRAWIYSVRAEQGGTLMWSRAVYTKKIAWMKDFDLDKTTSVYGSRNVIGIGPEIFFHDYKCEGGDDCFNIVSQERINASTIRFTLEATYSDMMDCIGKIIRITYGFYGNGKDVLLKAVDIFNKTIDIEDDENPLAIGSTALFLPNDFPTASFENQGVSFILKSAYLTPGIKSWTSFRYAQLMFKGTSWAETDKPYVLFKWKTINNSDYSQTNIEFLKKQGEPLSQSMVELDQKGQAIQLIYEGKQWTARYFIYSLNLWVAPSQSRELFMWRQ